MKLGLLGYGKMGQAVERVALSRKHDVSVCDFQHVRSSIAGADCVIDFTHADLAPDLIRQSLELSVPVVSGTTGWNAALEDVQKACLEAGGAFLWSPNFSIGMHLTFALNKTLASLMARLEEYDVTILETHHTAKKDKPSGTAIALAGQVLERLGRKRQWDLAEGESLSASDASDILWITARRMADVKGLHEVVYRGPHDSITLKHEALSRDGFAFGAVLAAEWLVGRQGVFSFEHVLEDLIGLK